jgi:TonB family protein
MAGEQFGPPTAMAPFYGPPTPSASDSAATAGEQLGPPTTMATFCGPPFSATDLVYSERISVLLSDAGWHSLMQSDSVFGPPSPAYLYEFGNGVLLGPLTPFDTVPPPVVAAQVDSVALLAKAERDSLRTARLSELAKVKSAANTQMQLAELYRFDLGYPDSALTEYDNLVERYAKTPYAAKALLGAADVLMESLGDTVAAQARLHRILTEYPYADYAGDAIARLHLEGTPADTAHPLLAYQKAEKAMQDKRNSKRALERLEEFIDHYPESRLIPAAEFAIAQLKDVHFPAEDSSIILAYKAIETKYPNTPFATAAAEKLTYTVKRPPKRVVQKLQDSTTAAGPKLAGTAADSLKKKEASLPKAPRKIKTKGEFVYPESEISKNWKGKVVYRIEIDYIGKISRYEILGSSGSPAIDEAARQAVEQTTFFFDSIPPESLNMPYLYEIDVTPPARQQDPLNQFGIPSLDPNKP